jgi:hypothetical protein
MNLTTRQQRLSLIALLLVGLLVVDRVLLPPLIRAWKDRAARLATLKKNVTQGALLLDREQAIRARWDQMRTNTLVPETSVAEQQLLQAFDRWAQRSRIGITAVRPQWKRTAEDYATLECRVDGFGSLTALTRFLYELERDPLGLKVDLVDITARDARGDQLSLGLQVSALMLNPTLNP